MIFFIFEKMYEYKLTKVFDKEKLNRVKILI